MNNMLIKKTPLDERPRERLVKYGKENVSTEDLIAIILKTGMKDYSSRFLASRILELVDSVHDLKNITLFKLMNIKGIGAVKAIDFLAALELGRRVYETTPNIKSVKLNSAEIIYEYFKNRFEDEMQECFYALYLDQQKKLINKKLLFKGTLNKSVVHPREIFKEAYLNSAAYIICIHNHPSGNVKPSNEDIIITNSLTQIGKIQKIPILDHIIIGKDNYYSFYENDFIKEVDNNEKRK